MGRTKNRVDGLAMDISPQMMVKLLRDKEMEWARREGKLLQEYCSKRGIKLAPQIVLGPSGVMQAAVIVVRDQDSGHQDIDEQENPGQ